MSTLWAEKYVGLPFVDGGRGWSGVDCWGLVRLIYKTEAKIDLPDYGEISASELIRVSRTIERDSKAEPWVEVVDAPKPFDVLVMRGRPLHVGVMVTRSHVLHVERHTLTVVVPVNHPSVKMRAIAYHRHRALVEAAA